MNKTTLQTLERGLDALLAVARTPTGLTAAEIAQLLGVNRAIAYRIIGTLAERGMVVRLDTGRIVMGGAAMALASHVEQGLCAIATPSLHALAKATGCAAYLSVRQADTYAAIATVDPPDTALRVHYRTGVSYPLDRGAPGAALLSLRPEKRSDSEAVRQARSTGYAVSHGALQAGATGIAAPLNLTLTTAPGLELAVGVVALGDLAEAKISVVILETAKQLAETLAAALA